MENALVNLDSAFELPLFSKQVAKDEINLDSIGIPAGGDGELRDGTVYLAGGEKVQAENVVDRRRTPLAIRSMRGARVRPKSTECDTGDKRNQEYEEGLLLDVHTSYRLWSLLSRFR